MPTEYHRLSQQCESNVKRCPHCDTYFGRPEVWKSLTARWWERKYNLFCPVCHWCGPKAFTRRGAISRWNDDSERLMHWRNLKP